MPILPIRNLGQIGVVTDVNSYDLPVNGISKANNVRFEDGKVKRANVFRSVLNTTQTTPVFPFTFEVPGNYDKIGMAARDGTVYFYQNGTQDNVTEGTWVASSLDTPWTYTYLQGIGYLNRSDRVPWFYTNASTDFAKLTNWNSTWRCRSLRSFKDYLIALNVTKGANSFPNMVKWSDIAQYGAVPSSWDETDITKSAGENLLATVKTDILDGLPLRDGFVIYSSDQVWLMEETGDALIFRFRKLFDNVGIINTNCAVEVDGRHFFFGVNNIYVHDGNTVESILDGSNWSKVFDNINIAETNKFFVTHNPFHKEVIFAYISGDPDANFTSTSYCNRGAVFNYGNQTWSFVDLPNIGGATISDYNSEIGWSGASGTWETFGGSWYRQEVKGSDVIFMLGASSSSNGLTASRLYGYEGANDGALPFNVSSEATKQAYVERVGVDLDDSGEELRAYKVIKSIYPQINVKTPGQTVDVKFSGVTFGGNDFTWSTSTSFSPTSGYKIDTREGGRYLAWRVETNDYNDFELSGFDADVVSTGRR